MVNAYSSNIPFYVAHGTLFQKISHSYYRFLSTDNLSLRKALFLCLKDLFQRTVDEIRSLLRLINKQYAHKRFLCEMFNGQALLYIVTLYNYNFASFHCSYETSKAAF